MTRTRAITLTLLRLIRPRGVKCLSLSPPYILIALVPIAVFLSLEMFVGVFAQSPQITVLPNMDVHFQWMEAAAQLQFFSLFILFVWFSAAVFIKFLCDLFLFDRRSRFWLTMAFMLCALAGGLIIDSTLKHNLLRSYDYFSGPLFTQALGSAAKYPNSATWATIFKWNMESFEFVLKVVNVAAGLAVPAFIVGGISCLAVARPAGKTGWTTQKETWLRQQERFKNYIYLSAALLVVALVFLKSWTHYPSFMLIKGPELAAYNAVVNSYSVLTGVEYTLLLAAYAIPVSFFLSRQADRIAYGILAQSPGTTILDIRAREKLTISTQDSIKTIVALLLPVITGSIETLSSILKSPT